MALASIPDRRGGRRNTPRASPRKTDIDPGRELLFLHAKRATSLPDIVLQLLEQP